MVESVDCQFSFACIEEYMRMKCAELECDPYSRNYLKQKLEAHYGKYAWQYVRIQQGLYWIPVQFQGFGTDVLLDDLSCLLHDMEVLLCLSCLAFVVPFHVENVVC